MSPRRGSTAHPGLDPPSGSWDAGKTPGDREPGPPTPCAASGSGGRRDRPTSTARIPRSKQGPLGCSRPGPCSNPRVSGRGTSRPGGGGSGHREGTGSVRTAMTTARSSRGGAGAASLLITMLTIAPGNTVTSTPHLPDKRLRLRGAPELPKVAGLASRPGSHPSTPGQPEQSTTDRAAPNRVPPTILEDRHLGSLRSLRQAAPSLGDLRRGPRKPRPPPSWWATG